MADARLAPIETGWQAADGTAVFARLWQPATVSGVVCLVHGLGEHSGRYGHVAARLGSTGLAVLAADLRGHGLSGGQRGHAAGFDVLLDDVDTLLAQARARFGERPLFLYGHSLGGSIVLSHLLRRRPSISAAVVTSPLLATAFEPPAWKLTVGRLLYGVVPTLAMGSGLCADDLSRDPAVAAAYRGDPLVHDRVSARLALDMLAAGEWAVLHAGELAVPLLLVLGESDRICSPAAGRRFAAGGGDRCTLVQYPGLYHEVHNEAEQAVVLDAIAAWLAERVAEAVVG